MQGNPRSLDDSLHLPRQLYAIECMESLCLGVVQNLFRILYGCDRNVMRTAFGLERLLRCSPL